jgi:hypothetical protein
MKISKVAWILLFYISWPFTLFVLYLKVCSWWLQLPYKIANAVFRVQKGMVLYLIKKGVA